MWRLKVKVEQIMKTSLKVATLKLRSQAGECVRRTGLRDCRRGDPKDVEKQS